MDGKLTVSRGGTTYSVGDRKAKIVILDIIARPENKFKLLKCKCDCGNEFNMSESLLTVPGRSQCKPCYGIQYKYSKSLKPEAKKIWME